MKPCLKQQVFAIIKTQRHEYVRGSNYIYSDIIECPRKDMPSGQGYELCQNICHQKFHAETDAIDRAAKQNLDITGADLYLTGHTYCCNLCIEAMRQAGLRAYWIRGVEFLLN